MTDEEMVLFITMVVSTVLSAALVMFIILI